MSEPNPSGAASGNAESGNKGHDNPAYSPPNNNHNPPHNTADPPATRSDAEDEDNLPCGYGPLRPACCQRLRNVKLVLFLLCVAGAVQGMIVSGLVNTSISTVEKRLSMTSTQSGLIVSMYDIASCLFLAPVSYLGGRGCKPRWLGWGVFIIGIGSIVYAMPHFITGLYVYENVNEYNKCEAGAASDGATNCDGEEGSGLANHRYWLVAGQFLHGAGATPLYTLGVTYLDENLQTKMTSLYVGIFYSMAIVGPAVGFLLGGFFLDFYCDFDAVDTAKLNITPDSPVWVGAWWLGFLLSGALAILIAIPMLAFPKYLPGTAEIRANRVSEAHAGGKDSSEEKEAKGCGALWRSVKLLMTNPTFIFLNLAGASEGFLLNGFAAFMPKFIESQFSVAAGWAAMLVGFTTIPCGGGGTFLGGYLVKRWDLRVRGIVRMCLVTVAVTLLALLVFLIQCPAARFAGVNELYGNDTDHLDPDNALLGTCNVDCGCGDSLYQPMCGADGIMYFSPCYAGCDASIINGTKKYFDCGCIDGVAGTAVDGKCESSCNMMAVFLVIFAVVMLFTFMTSMPALTATLRCVPDEEKSLALGIQWIMVRCLGTIPGPIAFGTLIDETCQLWQGSGDCGSSQGSCYFYNNKNMSYYLLAIGFAGKFLSLVFFIFALWLYKPPPEAKSTAEENDEGGENGDNAPNGNVNPAFSASKDSDLNVKSGNQDGASNSSEQPNTHM